MNHPVNLVRALVVPVLVTVAAAAVTGPVHAEQAKAPDKVIHLWPNGPPGRQSRDVEESIVERGEEGGLRDRYATGITDPRLNVFEAEQPNGIGVLISPGGGYQRVVIDKEGFETARWFADRGITAFVLLYRLPAEFWASQAEVPLQDAQRAMRLIRSSAREFRLDPRCIGSMGFSAGGHVAAMLANRFDATAYSPADDVERQSARPDFSVLMYPVISMQEGTAHAGSRSRLLGDNPSKDEEIAWAAHRGVTTATPPTFLLHAADDKAVPVENTLLMYEALRSAGVPAALHVFIEGGHGFGLRNSRYKPIAVWPRLVTAWITEQCSRVKGM